MIRHDVACQSKSETISELQQRDGTDNFKRDNENDDHINVNAVV